MNSERMWKTQVSILYRQFGWIIKHDRIMWEQRSNNKTEGRSSELKEIATK